MQVIEFLRIVRRCLLRTFFVLCIIAFLATLCAAYARFVEPHWLRIKHITLSKTPTVRIIHNISYIHFKGDTQYLEKVMKTINALDADIVCFTGDLVEDACYLEGALRILSKVNKPLYGIPGNHDQWALRSFDEITKTFRQTGGDWLVNTSVLLPSNRIELVILGNADLPLPARGTLTAYKRILLEHYPDTIERLNHVHFDLILAGHTHGGQVRVPIAGPFLLPFDVGKYDIGLFQTPVGPLYVNPGLAPTAWTSVSCADQRSL